MPSGQLLALRKLIFYSFQKIKTSISKDKAERTNAPNYIQLCVYLTRINYILIHVFNWVQNNSIKQEYYLLNKQVHEYKWNINNIPFRVLCIKGNCEAIKWKLSIYLKTCYLSHLTLLKKSTLNLATLINASLFCKWHYMVNVLAH